MKVKKIFKNIAVFAVGALSCLCFVTSGFQNWGAVNKQVQKVEQACDSFLASVTSGDGITLSMARASADEGIATVAESSYVLTATVTTSGTVADSGVTWSIAWKNPSSTWASGKSVADYVTISPSGLTCSASNKAAFGEPIVVTATAKQNAAKKASCEFNYVSRVTGVEQNSDYYTWDGDEFITTNADNVFNATLMWGTGTVMPTTVTASNGNLWFDDRYAVDHCYAFSNGVEIDYTATVKSHEYVAAEKKVKITFHMSDVTLTGGAQDVGEAYDFLETEAVFGFSFYISTSYGGNTYQSNDYFSVNDNGGVIYGLANSSTRITGVTLDKTGFAF